MNEFKTDVQGTKGFYTIEYRTNSRANYEEAQELLRKFVDNKPKTNFDRIVESVESLAEFVVEKDKRVSCFGEDYYWDYLNDNFCFDSGEAKENLIKWLQQEVQDD